ncbi:MAG: AAA family ATPase, partial [Oscillospiraceae bacterium]|nr:AAA family ATPase [Oscillospiraceae bacterium]
EETEHNKERKNAMQNEELEIIRMSEIQMREVEWLWYPYIPFGKLTIIQGDPGEGKTTFALRLAAACSTGRPMPGMESLSPFNVIYQSAEDGLEDTIKPRLTEAGADQERVINIREDKKSLHLLDSRIEKAILQCDAKLLILDPLQGYLGERIDMNRANEIREVMKAIGQVAQRTGCAIVLVGHLNKATGMSSAYRGLGSIDFRAAARSVLVVGRLRKNKNIRVIVHDKSSLAPEGKSLAFNLGNEEGFRWLDGYDGISAEDLLSGLSSQQETKTMQAEEIIRTMLEDGAEIPGEEIVQAAARKQISRRTVNEAKKNIAGIVSRKVGTKWMWSIPNEDCNIAEVSSDEE